MSIAPPPKLLDRVRQAIRVRHYSLQTEECYVRWCKQYIVFHRLRHPAEMAAVEINAFLTHLAVEGQVSASTQNQAFAALLFMYRHVLEVDPGTITGVIRAKRPIRLPVVLSRDEVRQLLLRVQGTSALILRLLYGAGLRVMECLRLRVHDVDFGLASLLIRHGKGGKDRRAMLPTSVRDGLRQHLARVHDLHARDLADGHGRVWLPNALERKYPNAAGEWGWQWVFPSRQLSVDPRAQVVRRHHAHPGAVARVLKVAARAAGVVKHATPHTLRHSFATHLLSDGVNVRVIKDLLGHVCIETTLKYLHVLLEEGGRLRSPLDTLAEGEVSHEAEVGAT